METVRYRAAGSRLLGGAVMAFAVAALAWLLARGQWLPLASYAAPLGLLGLLGWEALWAPYVEVSDGGVELRNLLRTVRLPWPSIEGVDGRFGLRLRTSYGSYAAWGAPAPNSAERRARREGEVAGLVRERLDRLSAAGHLDDPRLERDSPDTHWHVTELVLASTLLLALAIASFV